MSKIMLTNPAFKDQLDKEFRYLQWLEETCRNILAAAPSAAMHVHRRKTRISFSLERATAPGSHMSTAEKGVSPSHFDAYFKTQYLKKSDPMLSEYIKAYCAKKTLSVVRKCLSQLKHHADQYDPELLNALFDQFKRDFGQLTPAAFSSKSLIIQRWESKTHKPNTRPVEDNYQFRTDRGEIVRSKNECIASNIVYRWQIPYKNEYPVTLADGREIFIDLKMLSPVNLKEYYLEIFGRMDDPKYAKKNFARINDLAEVGITLGHNLLVAFDYPGAPFDTAAFRKMLESTVMHP